MLGKKKRTRSSSTNRPGYAWSGGIDIGAVEVA
jgi:hypothetical protein